MKEMLFLGNILCVDVFLLFFMLGQKSHIAKE